MRKDMAKVLVERPRLIDSTEHRGRKLPAELLPKALGMRRSVREAGGFKQLNENLAPLRRYRAHLKVCAQKGAKKNTSRTDMSAHAAYAARNSRS